MDYFQELYHMANNYWLISLIMGVGLCFIESFLPVLPLIAIVGANALLFGLFPGLMLSWVGSGSGTLILFLIVSKFNENKLFNKIINEKIDNSIKWIQKKGFRLLFFAYACPFMPSSLITIACAFCKTSVINFAPAMLAGKFVMFLVVSYPSSDIESFIKSPIKIIIFSILVLMSWKIGKKVNDSLNKNRINK